MRSSDRQETHFFDWRCGAICDQATETQSKEMIEEARAAYSSQWRQDGRLKINFEKTPRYLFDPVVPKRIKTIAPWSKIIMLLRDPVERAYSMFKMNYDVLRVGRNKEKFGEVSFETCVDIDIQKLNKTGIINDDSFWEVDDEERERRWLEYWKIANEDKLTRLGVCTGDVSRGLYFLQLSHWFKEYNSTEDRGKIFVMKSESLLPDKETNMIDIKPITDFIGVNELEISTKGKIHATSSRFGPMNVDTKQKLCELFDPFNKKLGSLLGKDWDDSWPYML